MLENVLRSRNARAKTVLTVKATVAVALVALAVGLPQIVHLIAGPAGGAKWLPMWLPVLAAGCLLGAHWGFGVGVLSPVVSFGLTAVFGDPMPSALRLPFMTAELAVAGAVAGLIMGKSGNALRAFPAVLLGALCGRTVFITLAAIFGSLSGLGVQAAWAQVQSGLIGLVVQSALLPFAVIGVSRLKA